MLENRQGGNLVVYAVRHYTFLLLHMELNALNPIL